MPNRQGPRVSILIKALNEEDNIAEAIESAIAALDGLSGEIILADSLSTDATVEIAEKYPIQIVTLAQAKDRSCGVGGQLGYQYSAGDYICQMDGDQRLYRGFLAAAIECLEADQHPRGRRRRSSSSARKTVSNTSSVPPATTRIGGPVTSRG